LHSVESFSYCPFLLQPARQGKEEPTPEATTITRPLLPASTAPPPPPSHVSPINPPPGFTPQPYITGAQGGFPYFYSPPPFASTGHVQAQVAKFQGQSYRPLPPPGFTTPRWLQPDPIAPPPYQQTPTKRSHEFSPEGVQKRAKDSEVGETSQTSDELLNMAQVRYS
jgi:hypothetical protein